MIITPFTNENHRRSHEFFRECQKLELNVNIGKLR